MNKLCGFLIGVLALTLVVPDVEACGKKGRRGSGGCGSGGQSGDASSCASCGQNGYGAYASNGFGGYYTGNCATCGTATVSTAAPSQAVYQWYTFPSNSKEAALLLNGQQVGTYEFSCNCYSQYQDGTWGPRGAVCPVQPPTPPPTAQAVKPSLPTQKSQTALQASNCICGCTGDTCQCKDCPATTTAKAPPPQDGLMGTQPPFRGQDALCQAAK